MTSYLERPGGRVAYDIEGQGALVICAPGMGDLRSVYRFFSPALRDAGHRVVTMDLRGHGDSDAGFDRYDDVATGEDMIALIDALGSPAVLVGNSMSAGAAVWAAAEARGRVAGLVLLGPFVRNPPARFATMLAFRLALLRPWGRAAWLAYYKSQYPGRRPPDLESHRARIRQSLRRPEYWRAFSRTTHTTHTPAEARLAEVRVPALVVMGTKDRDFTDPEGEADFVAGRLDARVLLVPGAGHYPQAEAPDVVVPAVLDFLAGLAGRAGGQTEPAGGTAWERGGGTAAAPRTSAG
jgi:pimeloyl-ACP methyl ester carboxylesterase